MRKSKDIRKYTVEEVTVEEVEAMRRRGESKTDWTKVDSITEAELEQLIAEDPEESGSEWDWDSAQLVIPEPKVHINLRVDADVLRFFKSQGKGYQTRMNAVLRSYMLAQQSKAR